MWPNEKLLNLFGIALPIVQAPMAGSSSLAMAVAVSEAGGLGSLACAALDAQGLRGMLMAAAQKTRKPLNVNCFTHAAPAPGIATDAAWLRRLSRYFDELSVGRPAQLATGAIQPFDDARCAVIEDFPPTVVSFHFGLPSADLVRRIKATGAKLMSSATTVAEARWLVDHGCDLIIAQGYEAGGHRGMFLTDDIGSQMGGIALVPQIVDAVDVPVIVAGGIADGRGIAAAFALGAAGVQIGTAFLFTDESAVNPIYREALATAKSSDTAITNLFTGRPARCLVNRVMREMGPPMAEAAPAYPRGLAAMEPLRTKAEQAGLGDFSAHYCGQAAALAKTNIKTKATDAAKLTRELAADAMGRLTSLAASPNASGPRRR